MLWPDHDAYVVRKQAEPKIAQMVEHITMNGSSGNKW